MTSAVFCRGGSARKHLHRLRPPNPLRLQRLPQKQGAALCPGTRVHRLHSFNCQRPKELHLQIPLRIGSGSSSYSEGTHVPAHCQLVCSSQRRDPSRRRADAPPRGLTVKTCGPQRNRPPESNASCGTSGDAPSAGSLCRRPML